MSSELLSKKMYIIYIFFKNTRASKKVLRHRHCFILHSYIKRRKLPLVGEVCIYGLCSVLFPFILLSDIRRTVDVELGQNSRGKNKNNNISTKKGRCLPSVVHMPFAGVELYSKIPPKIKKQKY